MRLVHKSGVMISSFLLAIALAGCSSGSVTTIIEETGTAIGQGSGSGETITRTETVKAEQFDSIAVKAEAMGIYVEPASGDSAEIELITDREIDNPISLDTKVQNRELQVTVHEDSVLNLSKKSQQGERKLVVKLPDRMYEQVAVQVDFGAVQASGIQAKNVNIEVDAGRIEANEVAGAMSLYTSAGAIQVDGYSMDHNLKAESEFGNIHIKLDQPPSSGQVRLQSLMGEVTANLDHISYDVSTANRKEGSFGAGGSSLEADVEVGSILVETAS